MINILSNGIRKAAQRAILTEKAFDLACDFIDELGADCSVCKSVCKKRKLYKQYR